ncbi:MAG: 50S ribosomal protein L9 [Rhodothermales bacterium]|nr:50S ribosomal protein L9 [Rhodothermales bacterium]
MKVILRQDLDNLGEAGDVVKVKNGYGRNYLIPQGLATLATPGAIRHAEEIKRQAAHKISQKKTDAQALAAEIEKTPLVIKAKVGEENRLFGTVTVQQLAVQLQERGIAVDRRKIDLEDIRTTGEYTAAIKLHSEVTANLKVVVENEEEEEEEETESTEA